MEVIQESVANEIEPIMVYFIMIQNLGDDKNDKMKNKIARVKSGKFKNKKCLILRTGNGWVQLQLFHSELIIAKRGYEIEVLLSLTEDDAKYNDRDMIGETVEYHNGGRKCIGIITGIDNEKKMYIIQNSDTKEVVSLAYGSFQLHCVDFYNQIDYGSRSQRKRTSSLDSDVVVKRNRSNTFPLPDSNEYAETINYINSFKTNNKGQGVVNWSQHFYDHNVKYPSMKSVCKYCGKAINKGNKYCWNSRCIASPAYRAPGSAMKLSNDESDVCKILIGMKDHVRQIKPLSAIPQRLRVASNRTMSESDKCIFIFIIIVSVPPPNNQVSSLFGNRSLKFTSAMYSSSKFT